MAMTVDNTRRGRRHASPSIMPTRGCSSVPGTGIVGPRCPSADLSAGRPRADGCRGGHPLVVGDDRLQLVTQGPCGRKVNGVQTAKHAHVQRRRILEQLVVELDDVDATQDLPGSSHGSGARPAAWPPARLIMEWKRGEQAQQAGLPPCSIRVDRRPVWQ
jgi:hypothetical protein